MGATGTPSQGRRIIPWKKALAPESAPRRFGEVGETHKKIVLLPPLSVEEDQAAFLVSLQGASSALPGKRPRLEKREDAHRPSGRHRPDLDTTRSFPGKQRGDDDGARRKTTLTAPGYAIE